MKERYDMGARGAVQVCESGRDESSHKSSGNPMGMLNENQAAVAGAKPSTTGDGTPGVQKPRYGGRQSPTGMS